MSDGSIHGHAVCNNDTYEECVKGMALLLPVLLSCVLVSLSSARPSWPEHAITAHSLCRPGLWAAPGPLVLCAEHTCRVSRFPHPRE